MTISILIPSRTGKIDGIRPPRFDLLARLLRSIQRTSDIMPDIWIGLDVDDPHLDDYRTATAPFHRALDIAPRPEHLQDVYNRLAKRCKGDILWCLNDDVTIETPGWDSIMREFVSYTSVAYLEPNDDTRNFNNNGQYACFPAMTRKAVNALGFFFNRDITISSDKWLKETFKLSGCPMIDLTAKIMLKHDHLLDDQTHHELQDRLSKRVYNDTAPICRDDAARLRKATECL